MRFLLICTLLFVSAIAKAGVCEDSDKGLLPEVAGKVVYSLGGENCLGENCYLQAVKEFDRCLDSERLLEFACVKGEVLEKEIRCSSPQVCKKGACRTK